MIITHWTFAARELLDWEPKHSLRDTLPRMTAALKADPRGWYEENNLKPPSELKEPSVGPIGAQSHAR